MDTTPVIDQLSSDLSLKGCYGNVIYPLSAICVIEQPASGSNDIKEKPRGTLSFNQKSCAGGVDISVSISGLKPFSKHGLHLH